MKTLEQKFREKFEKIKGNTLFYLIGLLMMLLLKLYDRQTDPAYFKWILAPTAWWSGILSGISFTWNPQAGFVNHDYRFIIAPSCAGIQFLMISITLLLFSFLHRLPDRFSRLLWVSFCPPFAVLFTLFTNGVRIALSIHLPVCFEKYGLFNALFTAERFHTLLGVLVYFSGLLLLWHTAEYAICLLTGTLPAKKTRLRCKPALFWYCFIVLGLPFLNGAAWKNHTAFFSYAAIVLTGCTVIVLSVRFVEHRLF